MNAEQRKMWVFESLKQSLQALALPASYQSLLFPNFVATKDELLLDFDHWREGAVRNYQDELHGLRLPSLAAIAFHLELMQDQPSVWSEDALNSHPLWQELRSLAKKSLDAFGWPLEVPPRHTHEYIPYRPPL